MRLEYGSNPNIAAWVADRAPLERPIFDRGYTIGIFGTDGGLLGGVVYHDHRPSYGTVQLSGAIDSWVAAGPQTARDILAFAFEKLGVFKVWTQSGLSNVRALRLLRAYGFKQEAVLAHEYGAEHCVRMRLLRREWEQRNGELRRAA